jgi:2-hydroxy-3-keto-5-methylthiopentenyl-1-phosphate phosphatase
MSVKFKELSSYYKLLFMFGDHVYDISAEMGKELDYLTKLYLVKAFNVRKIVLENQKLY